MLPKVTSNSRRVSFALSSHYILPLDQYTKAATLV